MVWKAIYLPMIPIEPPQAELLAAWVSLLKEWVNGERSSNL